jgi:hypothetical protein
LTPQPSATVSGGQETIEHPRTETPPSHSAQRHRAQSPTPRRRRPAVGWLPSARRNAVQFEPPSQGGKRNLRCGRSAPGTPTDDNLTITNTGTSAVNGWSLKFTLGSGQTITSGWNATYAPTSGQVTATNVSYNAAIAPGGSVAIGFQASHSGNNAAPSGFTLNGTACS